MHPSNIDGGVSWSLIADKGGGSGTVYDLLSLLSRVEEHTESPLRIIPWLSLKSRSCLMMELLLDLE